MIEIIAHGPVLPGYADYFGATVNLASRLCTAAAGGEVLLAGIDSTFISIVVFATSRDPESRPNRRARSASGASSSRKCWTTTAILPALMW